jgi:hypothetical protein
MILSNPVKSFLLALVFLSLASGCRFWQNTEDTNTSPGGQVFTEDNNELPFSTREPEVFQARIAVTSGGIERVSFVAKNGLKRRYDFGAGEKNATVWLRTDREYLLLPGKDIFAEQQAPAGGDTLPGEPESLTAEWLNARTGSDFEAVGIENGTKKFIVKLNGSAASEAVIFIDEVTGLAVRQEFYSINGEQRDLLYSVEMRDVKMEAGDELFAIPKDYRKVTMAELQKAIKNG